MEKGAYTVEPSLAVAECMADLDKLSYKNFPIDEVLAFLQKNPLSIEHLEPYLFFSDARYTRNLIHKTNAYELLVYCWKPGQKNPTHKHENEKGWVRVVSGTLDFISYREEATETGITLKKQNSSTGSSGFIDGPATIHHVINSSQNDAVSLHVFAPPFTECILYDGPDGKTRTTSIGYHSIQGKLVGPEDLR